MCFHVFWEAGEDIQEWKAFPPSGLFFFLTAVHAHTHSHCQRQQGVSSWLLAYTHTHRQVGTQVWVSRPTFYSSKKAVYFDYNSSMPWLFETHRLSVQEPLCSTLSACYHSKQCFHLHSLPCRHQQEIISYIHMFIRICRYSKYSFILWNILVLFYMKILTFICIPTVFIGATSCWAILIMTVKLRMLVCLLHYRTLYSSW